MKYKTHIIKPILSVLLTLCLCMSAVPLCVSASGTTYYVSPNGSGTNGLSAAAAFQTLAQAASVMQSGDSCIILPGVYHEELRIDGKDNLTFSAQEPGTVIVTACDAVTGWQKDNSMTNVWVADAGVGVYNGDGNIVFKDGELCYESRWPDVTHADAHGAHPLLNRDNYARVDQGGTMDNVTIYDADLAELKDLNLVGAYTWSPSGAAYWSYVAKITAHNAEANTITTENAYDGAGYLPRGNEEESLKNIYYIMGHKGLLSMEGEWYKEEPVKNASGKLYMYHVGNTAPVNVELRAREYTVRVNNASNITIEGVHFRGGILGFGRNTTGCTVKNSKMETVDYRMPRKQLDARTQNTRSRARGIIINGTNNSIVDCELFNFFAEGILLLGNENRVVNNYIHDFNFEASYADGVRAETFLEIEMDLRDWDKMTSEGQTEGYILETGKYGNRHLVSHNTMIHCGRSTIGGYFRNSEISYNDLADTGRLTRDGGVIYLDNFDYDNSEFHHNVLRDTISTEGIQGGFYCDSLTTGLVAYKNLIYNHEGSQNDMATSSIINYHSLGILFINNTFINETPIDGAEGDHAQTVFVNNLVKKRLGPPRQWLGLDKSNNGENFSDWNNAQNHDYTLSSSAISAIDKAIVIPGINDDYVGAAPDLGAFEYGAEKWLAGHEKGNTSYNHASWQTNRNIPYKNFIANGGFEYGEFNNGVAAYDAWNTNDAVSYFRLGAWEDRGQHIKGGNSMLKLSSGQSITQTICALKPNTIYEIGGYGLVADETVIGFNKALNTNGEIVSITAIGDGGETAKVSFSGNLLPSTIQTACVKTGERGTITVTLSKNEGTLFGYLDEVRMREAYTSNEITSGSYVLQDYSVTDERGKLVYGVQKGDNHVIKGTVLNNHGNRGEVTISVTSYMGNGTIHKTSSISKTLESCKTADFQVTIESPLSDGAYMVLQLIDESGTECAKYTVSESMLSQQYKGTYDIFVQAYSVRNGSGQLISQPLGGEMNIFELALVNKGESSAEMRGIAAVYVDGRLTDVMHIDRQISPADDDKVWFGTVLPSGNQVTVKVFAWNNMTELKPLVEAGKFGFTMANDIMEGDDLNE